MKTIQAVLLGLTLSTAAWADISNVATCSFTDVGGAGQPAVQSNVVLVSVTTPPTMTLTKTANPSTVAHGGTVTFTIAYKNNSSVTASNVVVADAVPAGSTLIPGSISAGGTLSGSTINWTLGTIAAGASGTVSFQVTAN